MPGRNLTLIILITLLFSISSMAADDLGQSVSGDEEIEDVLGASRTSGESPYIIEDQSSVNNVENSKPNGEDYIFNHGVKEVTGTKDPKKKFEDFGYTSPGSFENQENYLETDKLKMAKEFRNVSKSAMNITFIKNGFEYVSNNDVINKTIGEGYKSMKGGALYFRHDYYLSRSTLINTHLAFGAGVGYNTGRGIFLDGTRSNTTFNLWEVPVDLGLGLEIPIYHWFKIAGTGGPSVLGLLQNRSDFERGEKNKRKYQYSPGYFANVQFKINLTGFDEETAYDLFTASQLTNLSFNLEARHQNYENFQDTIQVSGTSFGIGFTFEYL